MANSEKHWVHKPQDEEKQNNNNNNNNNKKNTTRNTKKMSNTDPPRTGAREGVMYKYLVTKIPRYHTLSLTLS